MDPTQPLADPIQAQGVGNLRMDFYRVVLCAGVRVWVVQKQIFEPAADRLWATLGRRFLHGHGILADPKNFLDSSV